MLTAGTGGLFESFSGVFFFSYLMLAKPMASIYVLTAEEVGGGGGTAKTSDFFVVSMIDFSADESYNMYETIWKQDGVQYA